MVMHGFSENTYISEPQKTTPRISNADWDLGTHTWNHKKLPLGSQMRIGIWGLILGTTKNYRFGLPLSDPTKPSAEPFRDSDRGTSPNSVGMDMPARVENATLWTLPGAALAQSCSGGARTILSKDALRLALTLILSVVQHF